MAVNNEARRALDLDKLPVPPGVRVLSLDVEDYENWDGEPALRVFILVDESTDEENISGAAFGDFESAIQESLQKHGIMLFPYISYAKPSDLVETDGE